LSDEVLASLLHEYPGEGNKPLADASDDNAVSLCRK